MPATEEAAPPDTPKDDDAGAEGSATDSVPTDSTPDPDDTLSPAVRRLVRQFDLDVTGIRGTGPSGRIRVGDVMGLLAGRTDTGKRDAPARVVATEPDAMSSADDAGFEPVATPAEPQSPVEPETSATDPPTAEPAAHAAVPTTTVFECDMSRVLAHRRKLRRDNVELLTTSYFLTALAAALEKAPELTTGESVRFGVSLTTADGRLRTSVLEVPDTLPEALDERVLAVDTALRANLHTPLEHASLLVHNYGESGSLLATPTPIGAGHVASIGIGRLRREIVARVIDGAESARFAACCHISLSFFPDRVPLHNANRALAAAVAILETWPE
ncbi:MAG TPA: E3 binding domain-containing protein [Gammaproteobacteria bacterium]|nr:E3 binding domain-containing protein [Gammaproteobacteria bacterium]